MKFAIGFYGVDHVLYGNDYPCWNPETALRLFDEVDSSPEERRKILCDNARRVFRLHDPLLETSDPASMATAVNVEMP